MSKTIQIHLVRHGRPDISREIWLSRSQYRKWWTNYGDVGIVPTNLPPQATIDIAHGCTHFVASNLPRAIETAEALMEAGELETNAKYVEAALPPPIVPAFLKAKPVAWGTLSRITWWLGYSAGEESHRTARQRARDAAFSLSELATRHGQVMLCGHGWFNRMIAKRLRHTGCRKIYGGGDAYWSVRTYVKVIPE